MFADVAGRDRSADPRRTVGAVWFDYDEDGDLDVITGNMDGDANGLYSQTNGTFADIATTAGLGGRTPEDKANGTVRPCVADVDDDGRLDLFFANYGKNGLFLNRGKGTFADVSAAWGIAIDARYDSCVFGDVDNDGDLDLYVNGTITGGSSTVTISSVTPGSSTRTSRPRRSDRPTATTASSGPTSISTAISISR